MLVKDHAECLSRATTCGEVTAGPRGVRRAISLFMYSTLSPHRRRVFAHRFQVLAVVAALATGGLISFAASDAHAGGAQYYGSPASRHLTRPIVTMMASPSGRGYWLAASDGGVFSYGDAKFHGSTGGMRLNQPVVGMATTPSGNGYWLVASDGGIFSFGDAKFRGSTGAMRLNRPVVGMAATADGNGYWLVASDGGIFSFGNAKFHGSTGGRALAGAISSITADPSGQGYWIAGQDGSIYSFGTAPQSQPLSAKAPIWTTVAVSAPRGGGYWFVTADGRVYGITAKGQFIADPSAATTKQQQISADLMTRVNNERAARGLNALSFDPILADFAQYWSANMAAQGRMFHADLNALFRNPTYGNRYRSLRENIFQGWGSWVTTGAAHVSLMESPKHRATILMPQLQSIGTGVTCSGGQLWVAEEFGVWLASPMPPEPSVPPVNPIARPLRDGPSC